MSLVDWLRSSVRNVRRGREGLLETAYELYVGTLRRMDPFVDRGTNIYEDDWDVLVLVDACRVDALRHVAGEYNWFDDVDSRRSVAGRSDDWMDRTFTKAHADEVASTIYVTGNPFAEEHVDDDAFAEVVHCYRSDWDDELDAMPARPITDATVDLARERNPGDYRFVVHYMQPHFPSIPAARGDISVGSFGRGGIWNRWSMVRSGKLSRFEVFEAYLENLRYVLEEVDLLLSNLDADTVIVSSDHGTALGEGGVFGHSGLPFQSVRQVPWVVTTASDEGSYEPESRQAGVSKDIEDQLSALGYQ